MASKLFFAPVSSDDTVESILQKVDSVFSEAGLDSCIGQNDLTAIKIHFGENRNNTHINPKWTRPVIKRIKTVGGNPFLTDTCVLYKSRRDNAVEHLRLAEDHGFNQEITNY